MPFVFNKSSAFTKSLHTQKKSTSKNMRALVKYTCKFETAFVEKERKRLALGTWEPMDGDPIRAQRPS
jgi:hypothetical protein